MLAALDRLQWTEFVVRYWIFIYCWIYIYNLSSLFQILPSLYVQDMHKIKCLKGLHHDLVELSWKKYGCMANNNFWILSEDFIKGFWVVCDRFQSEMGTIYKSMVFFASKYNDQSLTFNETIILSGRSFRPWCEWYFSLCTCTVTAPSLLAFVAILVGNWGL